MSVRLGRNVRRLRLSLGMSQRKLGLLAGYAKSTVCEIEKGRYDPSAAQIPGLASALQAGIEELFEGVS